MVLPWTQAICWKELGEWYYDTKMASNINRIDSVALYQRTTLV